MANLDITKSAHRIRIYLFNDRIRIRKAYEAAIQEVISAEVNWSGITLATAEFTNEFVGWLKEAADIAQTLDYLIETEDDFKRVVAEPWPKVRKPSKATQRLLETINIADHDGKIIINYPAAWVEESRT